MILAYSASSGNLLRTTTDAAGRFTFPNADNKTGLGRWSVSVEAAGFAPAWKMVVPKGEIPLLQFSLSPAKPFRGQVVDNKGLPVAGAQVMHSGKSVTSSIGKRRPTPKADSSG